MGAFNLADKFERLEFHGLAEYGIPDGVIPEPSESTVQRWKEAIWQTMIDQDLGLPDDATLAQAAEALISRDNLRIASEVNDAYAELCGGKRPDRPRPPKPAPLDATNEDGTPAKAPTAAAVKRHADAMAKWEADTRAWIAAWTGGVPTRQQLEDLPYRPAAFFYGWLSGEFLNPEGAPAGTRG